MAPYIKPQERIPFWRDVRILAMIGQAVFMLAVLIGIAWFISNFVNNAERQGLEIGFDFLDVTAAFDIKEGIAYDSTDSFGRALWVGLVNTIRVSFIGIILTTFLAVVIGIARLSNNWLLSRIAAVYIEIIRNIPLLVLLYFIYFGVILQLPAVKDSMQPLDLPIFLNQRGVFFSGLIPTAGFPMWLAFVVLGFISAMVLWVMLSRREEATGRPVNKFWPALLVILLISGLGWSTTQAYSSNQAILVPERYNIDEFDDFEKIYLTRVDEQALRDLETDRALIARLDSVAGLEEVKAELADEVRIIQEAGFEPGRVQAQLDILDSARITVCGLDDSVGVSNAASQFRQRDINVRVRSEDSSDKVASKYGAGDCDLAAGTDAEMAGILAKLDNAIEQAIVPVTVPPLVVNTPAPAGFNIQGGTSISPEFTALLFGLVLYTGAFAAEIVRAGIMAVSKGQSEAARALGLTEYQRLRYIVLPQALRVIIPPMTSQYLNLTKNSSLAVAIGYPDLVSVGNTVMNQSGFAVQVIIIFIVAYLTLSLSISAFLNWYNDAVALVER